MVWIFSSSFLCRWIFKAGEEAAQTANPCKDFLSLAWKASAFFVCGIRLRVACGWRIRGHVWPRLLLHQSVTEPPVFKELLWPTRCPARLAARLFRPRRWHARTIHRAFCSHSESTTAQEQCATSARWTKPRGRPLPCGGASTSNGALLRGRCSVASDVSVVVHRGGPYDAARTAQRLTISQ